MNGMHLNFTPVVHDAAAIYHVNRHSGTGYLTLGPVEYTILHPEDAYRISEAFLGMAREMEEWRAPDAPGGAS